MVMFCIAVHDSSCAATEKAQQLPQPPCIQSGQCRQDGCMVAHVCQGRFSHAPCTPPGKKSHLVLHWADDALPGRVVLRHAPVDGAVARGQGGIGRLQQLPVGMRKNVRS